MPACVWFFCFNAPAPTELYTLSLHDALPISVVQCGVEDGERVFGRQRAEGVLEHRERRRDAGTGRGVEDRKSTRLNSSHEWISYAVFCLKKKRSTHYTYSRPALGTTGAPSTA